MTSESVATPVKHILVLEDALYRRTLILEANQYTLGRHSSNNIQMHSKQASRKHATLLRKFNSKTNQEVFWIIDGDLDGNKSQNGIYVNGEKCLVRELKDGDLINFGCDINASYHSSSSGLTSVGEEEGDYPNSTPLENAVPRPKNLVISEGNLEEMSAMEEETFHDDVYLDALTQLPNRTLFLEYIYIAISNARRKKHKAGLLFFNLSNLSEIQQSLGMAIWEQAIKQVGQSLRSSLRHGDIVARWADSEFMILFPKFKDADDLDKIQARIFNILNQPLLIEQYKLALQVSSGSAIYPQDSEDLQTLLGLVQKNLTANAPSLDTSLVMTETLATSLTLPHTLNQTNGTALRDEKASATLLIQETALPASPLHQERFAKVEKRLQQALDGHEINLVYQPEVNLQQGYINAMEALVRWQHPQKGIISPKQFLPWVDHTEMVIPVTRWILATACHQNKHWQVTGIAPLIIAVNLSDKQFYHPGLLDLMDQVLKETELEPQWLELEISETAIAKDLDKAKTQLKGLKDKGIRVALDDFGEVYGGARLIQTLPFDKIKLHPSLMGDLGKGNQECSLLAILLKMGHELNLQMVAEGVETQIQVGNLQQLQCFIMQGYRFSLPLNQDGATKFLLRHHTLVS